MRLDPAGALLMPLDQLHREPETGGNDLAAQAPLEAETPQSAAEDDLKRLGGRRCNGRQRLDAGRRTRLDEANKCHVEHSVPPETRRIPKSKGRTEQSQRVLNDAN